MCAVVDAVRSDLLARSKLGIQKYGTTISDNDSNLRERLQHAYEEALDLANYLKWSIMALDEAGMKQRPVVTAKFDPSPTFWSCTCGYDVPSGCPCTKCGNLPPKAV